MNLKCWSILVIEDDAAINDVVCSTLKGEGYECVSAYSGTEARLLLQAEPSTYSFDLVICDLMLPGMPGEEVVAFIRAQSNVPILVISAKAEVVDRVSLLRQGVDDYLVKPFDLDELVARVEALLRRSALVNNAAKGTESYAIENATEGVANHAASNATKSATNCADETATSYTANNATENTVNHTAKDTKKSTSINILRNPSENAAESITNNAIENAAESAITFGEWTLDENQRRFEVRGIPIRLTRTEFDIVMALMRHPRKVFTKRELYEAAWREESFVEEKAISTHISNIRTKLKATGTDSYIETVWGIGFKLADSI